MTVVSDQRPVLSDVQLGRIDARWRSANYLSVGPIYLMDNPLLREPLRFIDHVINKKTDVIRVYLPPDASSLLWVAERCRQYVDVTVAGKQPQLQYMDMDSAIVHCTKGIDIWHWASSVHDGEPDVVMGCAGDVPTMETLAAVQVLRARFPNLRIRLVDVVDLMRLQDDTAHPHGLSGRDFDALFTTAVPVVFAYHGYLWLIHRLTYHRSNHKNSHVRGYKEEGTTTAFHMCVLNLIDRYNLATDVIDRVPRLQKIPVHLREELKNKLIERRQYVRGHGQDLPEIRNWQWAATPGPAPDPSDQPDQPISEPV